MKYGRNHLYVQIIMVLLLIISTGSFFILIPELNFGLAILFIAVILLGLLSLLIAYLGVKRNEEKIKNLPEPYKKSFINAQEAIYLSQMPRAMKKENLDMVLEIFEHAALAGRNVKEVTGDFSVFIENFTKSSKHKMSVTYWFFYCTSFFLGYIIAMKLYEVIRLGSFTMDHFKSESIDVGILIVYALISYVFMPWLLIAMRKSAKAEWSNLKKLWLVLPFSVPFGLFAGLILMPKGAVSEWMNQSVKWLDAIENFSMIVVAFMVSVYFMNFMKRRLARKQFENDSF
ncbi:MAG: DUF1048 domain-containing protein [Clostridia bacterium]|nr:DUF1048 domain-containing protein [Clostridia bacterium]